MNVSEKLALAKSKTNQLAEGVLRLIRLRATNELVVYTDVVSGQVPESFAGHALACMQRALFEQKLVRLCAMRTPFGRV